MPDDGEPIWPSDQATTRDGEPIEAQLVVQTHFDGDPRPRPDELERWNARRREQGLERVIALILLPRKRRAVPKGAPAAAVTVIDGFHRRRQQVFAGLEQHGWAIFERDGVIVCEPEEVQITVGID